MTQHIHLSAQRKKSHKKKQQHQQHQKKLQQQRDQKDNGQHADNHQMKSKDKLGKGEAGGVGNEQQKKRIAKEIELKKFPNVLFKYMQQVDKVHSGVNFDLIIQTYNDAFDRLTDRNLSPKDRADVGWELMILSEMCDGYIRELKQMDKMRRHLIENLGFDPDLIRFLEYVEMDQQSKKSKTRNMTEKMTQFFQDNVMMMAEMEQVIKSRDQTNNKKNEEKQHDIITNKINNTSSKLKDQGQQQQPSSSSSSTKPALPAPPVQSSQPAQRENEYVTKLIGMKLDHSLALLRLEVEKAKSAYLKLGSGRK